MRSEGIALTGVDRGKVGGAGRRCRSRSRTCRPRRESPLREAGAVRVAATARPARGGGRWGPRAEDWLGAAAMLAAVVSWGAVLALLGG